jgi:hypothetical protein
MLKKARNDYIEDKYLPKNITLEQYYHLRQDDVNAMLKHWTERQAAGEVPFQFKKEVEAARKKYRTPEENDANSNAELDEGPREDLQSGYGSHARGNGEFSGQVGSNSSNGHALPGQGLGNAALGNAAENPNGVGWSLNHSDSRR